jgi:hypothetical protein
MFCDNSHGDVVKEVDVGGIAEEALELSPVLRSIFDLQVLVVFFQLLSALWWLATMSRPQQLRSRLKIRLLAHL